MAKNLLIVESPAKAKTINKYLGKEFQVLASYGHVRDLIPKEGAVDTEHDFAMHYALSEKSIKHVDAIAKAAKGAEALYLRSEEHTSELQSLMRISYAVFCLKKKIQTVNNKQQRTTLKS